MLLNPMEYHIGKLPRRGPPLPAPFDRAFYRYQLCAKARVCEATASKWLAGDQTVSEPYCRQLVMACASMGIVLPIGAKLPEPIGAEPAPPKHLQVVS